jgi:hypothetical protein
MSVISEFCDETEALLLSCIQSNQSNNSDSIKFFRNHFINLFLKRFLPATIQIGSGEIVDNFDTRSAYQDIVLYRSNFPVFPTTSDSKIFLSESVLATIQILPPDDRQDLVQPFARSASVRNLRSGHFRKLANDSKVFFSLPSDLKPKTFIFSFQPWADRQSFYDNYQIAKQETLSVVPDGICMLGENDIYTRYDPFLRKEEFFTDKAFARFFNHLFDVLYVEINESYISPGRSSSMTFDLMNYFVS